MKLEGKYRFGLGFKADTQERIQVGDFLDSLGNKKSEIVIRAVAEYIVNHPEIAQPKAVQILAQPHMTQEDIKAIVIKYMSEYRTCTSQPYNSEAMSSIDDDTDLQAGVEEMLGNLDFFNN